MSFPMEEMERRSQLVKDPGHDRCCQPQYFASLYGRRRTTRNHRRFADFALRLLRKLRSQRDRGGSVAGVDQRGPQCHQALRAYPRSSRYSVVWEGRHQVVFRWFEVDNNEGGQAAVTVDDQQDLARGQSRLLVCSRRRTDQPGSLAGLSEKVAACADPAEDQTRDDHTRRNGSSVGCVPLRDLSNQEERLLPVLAGPALHVLHVRAADHRHAQSALGSNPLAGPEYPDHRKEDFEAAIVAADGRRHSPAAVASIVSIDRDEDFSGLHDVGASASQRFLEDRLAGNVAARHSAGRRLHRSSHLQEFSRDGGDAIQHDRSGLGQLDHGSLRPRRDGGVLRQPDAADSRSDRELRCPGMLPGGDLQRC